jgi:DNA-binding MarR family transcriptional regulator
LREGCFGCRTADETATSRTEIEIICLVIDIFLCATLKIIGKKLDVYVMTDGILKLDTVPAGASSVAIATQRLSRLLTGQLGTLLAQQSNLSLVDWRICVGLADQSWISQTALVGFTKMQQAQVSRSLSMLEQRGLIKASRSKTDRRIRQFALSDQGRAHFHQTLPVVAAYCQGVDQILTDSELTLFLTLAEKIANASVKDQASLNRGLEEAVL